MKIVFFLPSLENGGAERVVSLLANELSGNNDVYILLLNGKDSDYPINDRVKIVPFNCVVDRNGGSLKTVLSILYNELKRILIYVKTIKQINPDCIISMLFTTNIIAILSNYFSRKKLIVSERNDPRSYGKVKQFVIKVLYKKANFIVCQSEYVRKYFDAPNSVVIYNPVNTEFSRTEDYQKTFFRIISAGRLIEQKNHKILIKAIKKVLSGGHQCMLDIYGEGPLKNELQQMIIDLELQNHVTLQGFSRDIKREMKNSDLFVLSSDFEGFPNVLIEAMSCCIPVISTKFPTGIAEELIVEGGNGYLFDVGDVKALAGKIESEILMPLDRIRLQELDKEIVNRFTVKEIAGQWLKVIEQ